jgi:hypothetical protein
VIALQRITGTRIGWSRASDSRYFDFVKLAFGTVADII